MSSENLNSGDGRPDALESVSAEREQAWKTLHDCERYLGPREIADEVDASIATAYRIINEMDDLGLVDKRYIIRSDGPTQEFLFLNPGEFDE